MAQCELRDLRGEVDGLLQVIGSSGGFSCMQGRCVCRIVSSEIRDIFVSSIAHRVASCYMRAGRGPLGYDRAMCSET